jgi:putative membrane protein
LFRTKIRAESLSEAFRRKRSASLKAKGNIMHKSVVLGALSGTLLFATAAIAANPAPKPTDPQIAHIAYTADLLDIEAGKQALDKSKDKDVRAFAQQMIGDHTAVNDQALALVKKLNVTPEDNPTSQSLTKQAEATRNKLASLSGAAFDKAYVDNEVAYHKAECRSEGAAPKRSDPFPGASKTRGAAGEPTPLISATRGA